MSLAQRRARRRLRQGVLWMLVGFAAPAINAQQAPLDPAQAWQQPVTLQLPQPTRAIRLRSAADAQTFIASAGLQNARTVPVGDDILVRAPLAEAQWQTLQSKYCGADMDIECLPSACRSIDQQSSQSAGPVLRLAPESDTESLGETDLGELARNQCQAPLGAYDRLPADDGAAPAGDLNLDLDLRSAAADRPSQSITGQVTADGQRVSAGSNLPDGDTSTQRVQLALGCESSSTPLDSLKPAQVPDRVVALVDHNAVAAVASRYQLTTVSQQALRASNETLVVYARRAADKAAMALLRAALLADPQVQAAQPEFVYRTAGQRLPADPLAGLTYAPVQLGARVLHEQLRGAGQQIAVIDTGIDTEHPDLVGRINQTFDTTGSGYAAEGHGTAVAGIIVAGIDNQVGGYGVAPEATLLSIKACEPRSAGSFSARCRTSTLVKALDIAMAQGAGLINMSLTGPPDPLVARSVRLAAERGALLIAAAGNGGINARPAFPAALPEVLAVTALDASRRLYAQANLGGYIDLAAPGVDLVTTAPNAGQPSVSGTSFAAAAVSGVAALLRQQRPTATAAELVRTMHDAVRDLGPAGPDERFGRGLLSACAAAAVACERAGQ